MRIPLRLIIVGILAVTLQWLFFGRLVLWGAIPDVTLLFVLWSAVRYGQMKGCLTGFLVGFALDAIYGLWGIHMFVKTLIGFLVGFLNIIDGQVFERSIRRIIEMTLVASLTHNSLMALFVLLLGEVSWEHLLWSMCVGSTLYTTCVVYLVAIFWGRSYIPIR